MDAAPPYTPPQVVTVAPPPMTDREFTLEVRKGVLIIVRACIRRYGMAWADFLPKGMAVIETEV